MRKALKYLLLVCVLLTPTYASSGDDYEKTPPAYPSALPPMQALTPMRSENETTFTPISSLPVEATIYGSPPGGPPISHLSSLSVQQIFQPRPQNWGRANSQQMFLFPSQAAIYGSPPGTFVPYAPSLPVQQTFQPRPQNWGREYGQISLFPSQAAIYASPPDVPVPDESPPIDGTLDVVACTVCCCCFLS